jgi:hypothetical protein
MSLKFKRKFSVTILLVIMVFVGLSYYLTKLLLIPNDQCDNLSKTTNINIGYGLASSKAIICLENKIQNEINKHPQSPDINLCFKPYYSVGSDCVIRIARETKNYLVCEQLYNLSKNSEYKWACIGKVSQALQDDNPCAAPTDHLKQVCQEAQKSHSTIKYSNFVI